MAARPLEPPRSLPAPLHAMAAAITGAAHPPRFTTGPATRHALAAAGALGATTGSVVHLAAPPAAVPAAVLAHELTHARHPVRRPRFLLAGMSGPIDDDERGALAAGAVAGTGAPGLARLTGGGGGDASAVGAGLVDQLPVGSGIGAVADVATRAARAAVIEAGASPLGPPGAMTAGFPGLAEGVPAGGGSVPSLDAGVSGGGATGGGTATGAGPGPSAGTTAKSTGAPLDIDRVMDAVEERLLREIERRGGRWAGVF